MDCYIVTSSHSSDVDIQYLGSSIGPKRFSIDHRINSVKAVPILGSGSNVNHLIVTGDSNGSCYIHLMSETQTTKSSGAHLLFRHERPILSLDIVHFDGTYLLFLGTTGGDILAFDVTRYLDAMNWNTISSKPLVRLQGHTMGTNALSAIPMPNGVGSRNSRTIRVGSGGDDQAISCFDVVVTINEKGYVNQAVVEREATFQNAGLSALKGIKWINNNMLVATGYDQQLSLWSWEGDGLCREREVTIDVGDVNCLGHYPFVDGRHFVAVAGAGVEIITLNT